MQRQVDDYALHNDATIQYYVSMIGGYTYDTDVSDHDTDTDTDGLGLLKTPFDDIF